MAFQVVTVVCLFVLRRRFLRTPQQDASDVASVQSSALGRVTWALAWSSATVLFIPLFRTLISAFDCTSRGDGVFSWDRDPTVDLDKSYYGEYVLRSASLFCVLV